MSASRALLATKVEVNIMQPEVEFLLTICKHGGFRNSLAGFEFLDQIRHRHSLDYIDDKVEFLSGVSINLMGSGAKGN